MFDFSPSACYRRIADETGQSLGYRGGDVAAWRRKLKRRLKTMVLPKPAQRLPLNVRSLWKKEHPLGAIEKIVFTSEPGADVPAYVCVPNNGRPPHPFMICVQGHTSGMHLSIAANQDDETQPIEVARDMDFAVGCMKRGVAALCVEQRCIGERKELALEKMTKHGCLDAAAKALMLGRTLVGDRVFDVDRGLDYLLSRTDADEKRIGILGHSVGGAVAMFGAALLPRIRFAMISSYFCTFRDSIMAFYHCIDHCVPGLFACAEMSDVLGLFAPRPVVIVAGEQDDLFPIRGVHRAFADLKKIYESSGAADRCRLVVGSEGHRFYAEQAWDTMLAEIERL